MNKDKIKQLAKTTGALAVVHWLKSKRDKYFSYKFECSIGDIILQRDVPSNNQLLLASRLLDVEAYIKNGDDSFFYQNTISYSAYGKNYKEGIANKKFRELIESYLKDGYHTDSYITCDKELMLMDGNHRMGLHLYEQIYHVNARMLKRKIPFAYSSDWYYTVGLPTAFMDKIYQKYSEIQQWLIESGNTFCALIETAEPDNVIADMKRLCTVLRIVDHDGIVGVIVQFSMPSPRYKMSNGLVSERAKQIEVILKKRYAGTANITVSKNCLEGKHIFDSQTISDGKK